MKTKSRKFNRILEASAEFQKRRQLGENLNEMYQFDERAWQAKEVLNNCIFLSCCSFDNEAWNRIERQLQSVIQKEYERDPQSAETVRF